MGDQVEAMFECIPLIIISISSNGNILIVSSATSGGPAFSPEVYKFVSLLFIIAFVFISDEPSALFVISWDRLALELKFED